MLDEVFDLLPSRFPVPVDRCVSVRDVAAALVDVWPDFLAVGVPVGEDGSGVWHASHFGVPCCSTYRVVVVALGDLTDSCRACPRCLVPQFGPSGVLTRAVVSQTGSLRLAAHPGPLDVRVRAAAMVRVLWDGPSWFVPAALLASLREPLLLDGVRRLGARVRAAAGVNGSLTGSLVAVSARDLHVGRLADRVVFERYVRAAAPAFVHVSPRDGVWVLHAVERFEPSTRGPFSGFGSVLAERCTLDEVAVEAVELFGVLCDDQFAAPAAGAWRQNGASVPLQELWETAQDLSSRPSV